MTARSSACWRRSPAPRRPAASAMGKFLSGISAQPSGFVRARPEKALCKYVTGVGCRFAYVARDGSRGIVRSFARTASDDRATAAGRRVGRRRRSEEHTSELQSPKDLVCRLLLEKKKSERRRGGGEEAGEESGCSG